MKNFKKVLIANRGEIAIRVARSLRLLGIDSVTLYTDEEADLPHARFGDESVNLGSGPLAETYLNIDRLVSLCTEMGVDAVHPGYGFLSERAPFALALEKAGIKLIGPPVAAMESMGDKKTSKEIMEAAGIPLIPGYHGNSQEQGLLMDEALKIGFPTLIKASAGGGGKGMRIVHSEGEFLEALEGAKREAMNAFGDDKVLIEKFITDPRHIEVQVMSDQHGNHFHLWERECSIQRRYQKIIEETPSPALSEGLRNEICQTAVKIAETMKYEGAGTVEFILDKDGKFYFLEMNTRLQVEHPITEMVTGLDLVEQQIRVARGEELTFKQEDIKQSGHALEVRLYAEDPDNGFLPATGRIACVGQNQQIGVRLDTGYEDGNEVTVSFDPMLAKLIVHSPNREGSIAKMLVALEEHPFLGIKTNREYLFRILGHKSFLEGETFTHFVETYKEDLMPKPFTDLDKAIAIASHHLFEGAGSVSHSGSKNMNQSSVWQEISGLRIGES
jgi:acetyl/propionyl-CoA carboxylase alpha subunit